MQSLVVMAVLKYVSLLRFCGESRKAYRFVILQPILILVCFLAADDGAPERLWLLVGLDVCGRVWQPCLKLSLSNRARNVAISTILAAS